jgi:hypothetical protein
MKKLELELNNGNNNENSLIRQEIEGKIFPLRAKLYFRVNSVHHTNSEKPAFFQLYFQSQQTKYFLPHFLLGLRHYDQIAKTKKIYTFSLFYFKMDILYITKA